MMAMMGARSPQAQARACELGVAMQLTNIARDVGEDARAGRLYLPRDWMREAGIDPDAWLQAPSFTPALGSVVSRLLAEADVLYERAALGISALPRDCRPAIQAARLVCGNWSGGRARGMRLGIAPGERVVATQARTDGRGLRSCGGVTRTPQVRRRP